MTEVELSQTWGFILTTCPRANSPYRDLLYRCVAEVVGTWLMVFVGTSVVAAAVLTGAPGGAVAGGGGLGAGRVHGHLPDRGRVGRTPQPGGKPGIRHLPGPGDFPARWLLPYWAAQLLGAALAGLTVLALYGSFIRRFEELNGLERGEPGSQLSTMMFGEYFPNPGMMGVDAAARALVSPLEAAAVEALGTGILVLMIFALVDRRNSSLPVKWLAPVFIGLTVAMIISMMAPLTMGGWNPARDFGPRLVSYFAGWGGMAIPGPSGGFWAYIAGPLAGGPIGAAVYEFLIRPAFPPGDSGD